VAKSFKGYISEVATFSPKNFPAEVGNNRTFTGAGERTTYVPTSLNNYKFKEGFPIDKSTTLYDLTGKIKKQLNSGEKIYFTMPAQLFRSDEFGIPKRTTLAAVSLKGFDQQPDGLVAISAVIKPGGNNQGRVGAGSKTQDMVAQHVKDLAYKKGIEVETEFKTARAGSTAPDLEMTIAKQKVQFEIKGTNNRAAPITFFDKSVKRVGGKIEILEDITKVYIKNLKVPEGNVKQLMQSMNLPMTFVGIMDFYQSRDPKIGLAGDKGVIKSGNLPKEFVTSSPTILTAMRNIILDHFGHGGDDYFVVHNRATDDFEMYFVGGGTAENVLKAPLLPKFKGFSLATYGGASGGATRVGLKIKL
jgi:hypothetical protein